MQFVAKLYNDNLLLSELLVKDYKTLLKTSYGDEPDTQLFINSLAEIFSHISNKPKEFFLNLDVVSTFLLLISLRINTFGDTCQVLISQKDKPKTTLTLNLEDIKDKLLLFENESKTLSLFNNKIVITLGPPSILTLIKNEFNFLHYVTQITILNDNGKSIKLTSKDKEFENIFNHLPAQSSFLISQHFNQYINSLQKINFLEKYNIENTKLNFIPTIESLIWFTKLFFNESLETYYDNMFYLSYFSHIDLQYIENCAVGEYLWFVRKLEEVLSQKASSSNSDNNVSHNVENHLPDDLKDIEES
jgi:hypothetical protein